MIPIESIRRVQRIIVHAGCADGTASAMILHDARPDAEVIAVAYGPERDALEPGPADLFCDMTPPPAKADAFVAAGAIVLDHHKGARELVARFGALGVYADADEEPGVSGAVLAYREVWLQEGDGDADRRQRIWRFADLAGARDTWQKQRHDWLEACAQAAALTFWGLEEMLDEVGPWLSREDMVLGRRLVGRGLARAREIAEAGCAYLSPVTAIFNDSPKPDSRISDVAEAMRELRPEVKLVAGFYYSTQAGRQVLEIHLRSSPGAELTAEQIAVANGGGGHDHAAGFVVRHHEPRSPAQHISDAIYRARSAALGEA